MPIGATILAHGRLARFRDRWQLTHPDILDPADAGRAIPLYRLTEGLTQGRLRAAVAAALAGLPALPEWLTPERVGAECWPAWDEAMRALHTPATEDDLAPESAARSRLAYDELLAGQLALGLTRLYRAGEPGRSLQGDGSLRATLRSTLPYQLTPDQERAAAEIGADLASPPR
jgi:ATP-dependent DNA helicase RecG